MTFSDCVGATSRLKRSGRMALFERFQVDVVLTPDQIRALLPCYALVRGMLKPRLGATKELAGHSLEGLCDTMRCARQDELIAYTHTHTLTTHAVYAESTPHTTEQGSGPTSCHRQRYPSMC